MLFIDNKIVSSGGAGYGSAGYFSIYAMALDIARRLRPDSTITYFDTEGGGVPDWTYDSLLEFAKASLPHATYQACRESALRDYYQPPTTISDAVSGIFRKPEIKKHFNAKTFERTLRGDYTYEYAWGFNIFMPPKQPVDPKQRINPSATDSKIIYSARLWGREFVPLATIRPVRWIPDDSADLRSLFSKSTSRNAKVRKTNLHLLPYERPEIAAALRGFSDIDRMAYSDYKSRIVQPNFQVISIDQATELHSKFHEFYSELGKAVGRKSYMFLDSYSEASVPEEPKKDWIRKIKENLGEKKSHSESDQK